VSKTNYSNGDDLVITEFRLHNPGSAPRAVELKVWVRVPGIPPVTFLNMGSDGSVVLAAGLNQNLGPLTLAPVESSWPRGKYEISSRLVDPVTGKSLSEGFNPFVIQ
jgi:hypothetical protein